MSEAKIIFEHIKTLRHLLTEAVGENDIIDAIDNTEYLYLYYDGDGNTEKGFRTVRPFVLGKTSKGKTVLRAWQDKGRSHSLGPNRDRPPRKPHPTGEHERWTDIDGKDKPGWRLFLVDNISRIYPTGDKFIKKGKLLIPPKYKEGSDEQMGGGIIAYVKTTPASVDILNVDDMDKPKVIVKPETPVTAPVKRWSPFYGADARRRPMDAKTVQKLYDFAMNVRKEKIGDLFVAIDDDDKYHFRNEKIRDRFPQNAIVGNLKDLYNDLVLKNREKSATERDFANRELDLFNKSVAGGEENNK